MRSPPPTPWPALQLRRPPRPPASTQVTLAIPNPHRGAVLGERVRVGLHRPAGKPARKGPVRQGACVRHGFRRSQGPRRRYVTVSVHVVAHIDQGTAAADLPRLGRQAVALVVGGRGTRNPSHPSAGSLGPSPPARRTPAPRSPRWRPRTVPRPWPRTPATRHHDRPREGKDQVAARWPSSIGLGHVRADRDLPARVGMLDDRRDHRYA